VAASSPAPARFDVSSEPLGPQQQELRATISDKSGRPPRLAIPAFLVAGNEAELQESGKAIADVLWKDVEFERAYQMIDQSVAAEIAPAPSDSLVYESWIETGADDVLVGSLQKTGASLQLDVRVMSVQRRMSTFS